MLDYLWGAISAALISFRYDFSFCLVGASAMAPIEPEPLPLPQSYFRFRKRRLMKSPREKALPRPETRWGRRLFVFFCFEMLFMSIFPLVIKNPACVMHAGYLRP